MKQIAYTALLLILIYCFSIAACGDGYNEGENYGDLLNSSGALLLTPEEHVGGWGRYDCYFCHPEHNIHLENRSSLSVDMAEIRYLTLTQGLASCPTCHGTNGL